MARGLKHGRWRASLRSTDGRRGVTHALPHPPRSALTAKAII